MNKIKYITINHDFIKNIIDLAKNKNEILLSDLTDTSTHDWLWFIPENYQPQIESASIAIEQATENNYLAIKGTTASCENYLVQLTPFVRDLTLLSSCMFSSTLGELCIFQKIWHGIDTLRLVVHESFATENIKLLDFVFPLAHKAIAPNLPNQYFSIPDAVGADYEEPYEEFSKEIRKGIGLAHKNQYIQTVLLATEARKFTRDKIQHLKEKYLTEEVRFSIACVVLPGKEHLLLESINSLCCQTHSNWKFLIIGFTPSSIQPHNNIKWHELTDEEDSTDIINNFLFDTDGLSAIIEAGDQLANYGLTIVAAEHLHVNKPAYYCNTVFIDSHANISKPTLLPEFDSELLRRMDYFSDAFWFNPKKADGIKLDANLASSAYYKFKLQFTIEQNNPPHRIDEILYFHHTDGGHNIYPIEFCEEEQLTVLNEHLSRCKIQAKTSKNINTLGNKIFYGPSSQPSISILIPTKDNLPDLHDCLDSIHKLTLYKNYEIIIIDNGSTKKETIDFLYNDNKEFKFTVLQHPGPFNYSKLINTAAQQASGEILIQLNNDTVIIDPNWLSTIAGALEQPNVGIVGVPLLFENGTLQHAGVGVGLGGVAGHYFYKEKAKATYMFFGCTSHAVPAVTGACLGIRKNLYQQVNGMDEELTTFYQDIDLCMKVAMHGLTIQYIAETALIHKESKSLKSKHEKTTLDARKPVWHHESDTFKERWLTNPLIWARYSRQATPHHYWEPDFRIISNTNVIDIAPLDTILTMTNDHGAVAAYRTEEPLKALKTNNDIQGISLMSLKGFGLIDISAVNPSTIILQRPVFEKVTRQIVQYNNLTLNCKLGIELDDLIHEVPASNPIHQDPSFAQSIDLTNYTLKNADFLVTTTDFLANYYSDFIKDIRIVNNFIDATRWGGLRNIANNSAKLRVCWAGGSSHRDDILSIKSVIQKTAHIVDWIFFGMCPSEIRPFVKEIIPGVGFDAYPARLASLNIDLAIAPLENNIFNRGKSHLKIIEFGFLGIPVLCSNIDPYFGDFPVIRVNNQDEWIEAINWLNNDRTTLINMAAALKQKIDDRWILQRNIAEWKKAWLN
ncbi:glycosyltransferase [Deefgea rivuli]|uniref:glycosyltransferase n=1 Tax=Deefgea rivuli TaxID=400948 RepID=UPI000480F4D1|nr:glycosyltransferase [Deefgea rivuli]